MRDTKSTTRPPTRRGIPLRIRLSLGSALRLTLAIAAFGFLAWQMTRRTMLEGAAGQARGAVLSMSTRSALGLHDIVAAVRQVAGDPAIVEALRSGVVSPETRAALARIAADTAVTLDASRGGPSTGRLKSVHSEPSAFPNRSAPLAPMRSLISLTVAGVAETRRTRTTVPMNLPWSYTGAVTS